MAPDVSEKFAISSVLCRHSKNLRWWTSVIARLQLRLNGGAVLQLSDSSVLLGKQRKIHPRDVRAGQPKRRDGLSFRSPFDTLFLLPLSQPYVNWAGQEGSLFHLRFSLRSLDIPIFEGIFLLCILATSILNSFFLF